MGVKPLNIIKQTRLVDSASHERNQLINSGTLLLRPHHWHAFLKPQNAAKVLYWPYIALLTLAFNGINRWLTIPDRYKTSMASKCETHHVDKPEHCFGCYTRHHTSKQH